MPLSVDRADWFWSFAVSDPARGYRVRYRFRERMYTFVFRLLQRAEVLTLSVLDHDWLCEELVLSCCLIEPPYEQLLEDWFPAGILSALARHIVKLSWAEPGQQQELVKRVQSWASSEEGRLEILAMAYLHIPIGRLWSMTAPEWALTMHAATFAAAAAGISVKDWLERGELRAPEPEGLIESRNRPLAPNLIEEYGLQWRKRPSPSTGSTRTA